MAYNDDTLFAFVNNKDLEEMLFNAYNAIQLTETWGFMKKDIETYMWSNKPEITIIINKMAELGYNGHSGTSFGWTMREMQFIAQNGLEAYKKKCMNR
jgi:hypothetical protein